MSKKFEKQCRRVSIYSPEKAQFGFGHSAMVALYDTLLAVLSFRVKNVLYCSGAQGAGPVITERFVWVCGTGFV